jgi:hypothetical protein
MLAFSAMLPICAWPIISDSVATTFHHQLQESRAGTRKPAESAPASPASPFGANAGVAMVTVFKVVCEPINLVYAEKKVQVLLESVSIDCQLLGPELLRRTARAGIRESTLVHLVLRAEVERSHIFARAAQYILSE